MSEISFSREDSYRLISLLRDLKLDTTEFCDEINRILAQKLESQGVKVYGYQGNEFHDIVKKYWSGFKSPDCTHVGTLIDIKELQRGEAESAPNVSEPKSERLSDEEIENLGVLEKKATAGPWEKFEHEVLESKNGFSVCQTDFQSALLPEQTNAAFIAAIRNAAPKLLSEISRLRSLEKELREQNDLWKNANKRQQSHLYDLESQLAKAKACLEFYANANYKLDVSQESLEAYQKRIYNDGGYRARDCLKELG